MHRTRKDAPVRTKGQQVLLVAAGLLLVLDSLAALASAAPSPVIGILSQPGATTNGTYTYIPASYVKWVEAGGARSIPIPYDAPDEMVDEIWTQVNGVLFPGGGSAVPPAAKRIWALINNQTTNTAMGSHESQSCPCCDTAPVPLWGTCLGFEYIVQLAAGIFDDGTSQSILESDFNSNNISLPLEHVHANYLYAEESIRSSVTNFNLTMNNHHQGISPDAFLAHPLLASRFDVTSTNVDLDGRPFVSTIEPKRNCSATSPPLPIYGVQYHPEKNAFEYGTYAHTNIHFEAIDHSARGIALSMHLAAKFVDKAREATNGDCAPPHLRGAHTHVRTVHEYTLIDKYPLVFSYPMIQAVKFEQVFVIPPVESRATKAEQ